MSGLIFIGSLNRNFAVMQAKAGFSVTSIWKGFPVSGSGTTKPAPLHRADFVKEKGGVCFLGSLDHYEMGLAVHAHLLVAALEFAFIANRQDSDTLGIHCQID